MERLTARQQQIFDLIRDNLDATGYPPTRAEIAQQLDQINLDNNNFQYDEDEEDFQEEDVDIPLEELVIIHVYYVVFIFLFPFFFGGIALRLRDKMIQKNFKALGLL